MAAVENLIAAALLDHPAASNSAGSIL